MIEEEATAKINQVWDVINDWVDSPGTIKAVDVWKAIQKIATTKTGEVENWDNTHLMFVGTDGEKWAYFNVYVHGKVECQVKMELSAPYTGNLCKDQKKEAQK